MGLLNAINARKVLEEARRKRAEQQTLAPGPAADVLNGAPKADPSGNAAIAQASGERQRKRSAAGSILSTPSLAKSTAPKPLKPVLRPRSLSGY